MKRKGARWNFKSTQPVAHDVGRQKSSTHLWRWVYSGLLVVLISVYMSWRPWSDPGLIPSNTDAHLLGLQLVNQPVAEPVLAVTPPATQQGIFIVSGANFVAGERVLLFAQPANAGFIADLNQARTTLLLLAEVLVEADGRLYVPINPLLINIRSDILPATVVAYTAARVVPSVTPINLYANTVLTPVPGIPPLPATPVPFYAQWEMDSYMGKLLSGQQRAHQTVAAPECAQLGRGHDKAASARWTTQIDVPLHAHYSFVLLVAGSARLSIDGSVIIDEWRLGDHEHTQKVFLHLMHGLHDVQLEYSRPSKNHCKLGLTWRPEYPDWCALYHNNIDLTGEPVAFRNIDSTSRHDNDRPLKTQQDPSQFIYINWEANAAAQEVNPDNWSVDITRTIVLTETGYYKFSLNVGDRDEARVYIDQHPIIDQWVSGVMWSVPITLSANQPHFVQVQFRDLGGPSMLNFGWIKIDWPN